VFGRKVAAAETGLSERSIRTCIEVLENGGNLTVETINKYSLVLIVKWAEYQGEMTSKRPVKSHKQ
jgi:hypothetical protein